MPPTLQKLKENIVLVISIYLCLTLCPYNSRVISLLKNNEARVLKFHMWVAHEKLKDPYLFVPRLFEEKWRDTVFGFPWCVVRGAWRVVRGAWRVARGAWCVVPSF